MWGATQPCSGQGLPVQLRPGGSGVHLSPPSAAWVARSSRSIVRFELRRRELADAGALQRAAGVGVGEGGADADPVEAADGAVAVVADRHPPAAAADQFANGVAVIAHVQREEAHPATVSLVDLADHVLLFDAVLPPRENQNESTNGPAEEVADPDRARRANAAGGRRGERFAGRAPARFRSRPGRRWHRLPAGPAASGTANSGNGQRCGHLVEPERPFVLVPERVDHGDHDDRGEDQADDERVAVPHRSPPARRAPRAAPPSRRAARRQGRSR